MSNNIIAEGIPAAAAGAITPLLQSQHQGTSDRQQLSERGDRNDRLVTLIYLSNPS